MAVHSWNKFDHACDSLSKSDFHNTFSKFILHEIILELV